MEHNNKILAKKQIYEYNITEIKYVIGDKKMKKTKKIFASMCAYIIGIITKVYAYNSAIEAKVGQGVYGVQAPDYRISFIGIGQVLILFISFISFIIGLIMLVNKKISIKTKIITIITVVLYATIMMGASEILINICIQNNK